jgi:aminoglycoside 2'-N-acetyltransferase I
LRALRAMLERAFADAPEGGLTDEDWEHTLGGVHVLVVDEGIVSHAAVVERLLSASGRGLRTGYVEGVATAASHRHRGHGGTVMREIGRIIQERHELGALATGIPGFYVSLGWEVWQGATFTITASGPRRTPDDDGAVMILRTTATLDLDRTSSLMCDWRPGEVW